MSKNAKALLLSVIGGVALMGMAIPAHAVIKVTKATKFEVPAWKIEGAANAKELYFESGENGMTGFSSAIDQEDKDWIYNDGKGSAGTRKFIWRGFPQLGEGGFNHPQVASKSQSKWIDDKMEGETLVLESWNTEYRVQYHFFSTHIAIKILEAKRGFTFLFEGPVGGLQEPTDWMVAEVDMVKRVVPSGSNCSMDPAYKDHRWGKFFYLGDDKSKQVWFVAKNPIHPDVTDEGYRQEANMVVTGFGRMRVGSADVRKLTDLNTVCTFGFLDRPADEAGHTKTKAFIEGTLANPFVAAGGGTTPPGTGGASGSGDGGVVATGGTTGSSDAAAMGGATSSGGAIGSGGSIATSGGTTTSSGGSTTTTSGGIAAKGGSTTSSGGTTASTGGTTTATGGVKAATGGSTGTKKSGDSGGCSFGSSSGGVAGFGMAMFALGMLMLRRRRSSK